jgi:elongation factor P
MLSTTDFRKGLRLELDGDLYTMVDFQHARTAQRRANVWTKLKNIRTGQVIERTFSAGERFEQPDFKESSMQYLYNDGTEFFFMDSKTYEQTQLSRAALGEAVEFLKEQNEYKILFYDGAPISIDMPPAVELKVVESEPAVKGDSVSNLTKEAVVETGLKVKVPLFIKEGDVIKIDTQTAAYLGRA